MRLQLVKSQSWDNAVQSASDRAIVQCVDTTMLLLLQTLQLDSAFVQAHKLGVARQLTSNELRAFISSMQEVEALMQV